MTRLIPRAPVPALTVPTLEGADWSIQTAKPERFSLVVFYRGLHCPICSTYVAELAKLAPDFAAKGVASIAVSGDPEDRARKAQADWKLGDLAIGHSLAIGTARTWGLFISSSRGKTSTGFEEPALFSEPGIFLVRPDQSLYWSSVQSMPFARPHFREILAAVDFVIAKDYPARGEA